MSLVRTIHQVWVQGIDEFKKTKFYKFSQEWPKLFPNWNYKLWSEQDYMPLIKQYSTKLVDTYNNSPSYAFKSDIARYVILWYHGGLYVDTDYEPVGE
jgi:mannosyltransferase OCH1-like enzyme